MTPNNGAAAIDEPDDLFTNRKGIFLQAEEQNLGEQNPERVQIQFTGTIYQGNIFGLPAVQVGDRINDVTGLMGYSFGNFEVNAVNEVVVIKQSNLLTETTKVTGKSDVLTVATYNVLNLSANGFGDFAQAAVLGAQITDNLGSPDVIALQEIQDNNGTVDDGTISANQSLQLLVDSISAASGPTYAAFDVAPINNTQGGNIRTAFLYNPARVDLVGFTALNPTVLGIAGADPAAFAVTRKPLAGTFDFNGTEVTVISVHNSSRLGSTPIFGGPQPFVQAAEPERSAVERTGPVRRLPARPRL